jgi:hypothetical protein
MTTKKAKAKKKQIPFGNDRKKGKSKTTTSAMRCLSGCSGADGELAWLELSFVDVRVKCKSLRDDSQKNADSFEMTKNKIRKVRASFG